jgi:hypothetical protein
MDGLFSVFLTQLATNFPELLAYVIGLLVTFAFWRRFPGPCLLVSLAMVVALSTSIGAIFLYAYLPFALDEFHWQHHQLDQMYTVVGLLSSLLRAFAMVMLLTAVFVSRRTTTPAAPRHDDRVRAPATGPDTRIQS